jgi:hypothetical protein
VHTPMASTRSAHAGLLVEVCRQAAWRAHASPDMKEGMGLICITKQEAGVLLTTRQLWGRASAQQGATTTQYSRHPSVASCSMLLAEAPNLLLGCEMRTCCVHRSTCPPRAWGSPGSGQAQGAAQALPLASAAAGLVPSCCWRAASWSLLHWRWLACGWPCKLYPHRMHRRRKGVNNWLWPATLSTHEFVLNMSVCRQADCLAHAQCAEHK